MKSLTNYILRVIVGVVTLSMVISPLSYAYDKQFYANNDIIIYDPTSVGPCSADTASPTSTNLSVRDKITQTMVVGFDTPDAATKASVLKYKFGGVYFNGKIDASVNSQTFDDWNSSLPSQLIVASDDEGGTIERFLSGKESAKDMAKMSDSALTAYAKQSGGELKKRGVTNVLAPVLDLDTGNKNAISPYGRSFGTTAAAVTDKAGAYADGMTSSGIGVTFKHFPGIGKDTANTDTTYQKLNMSIADLSEDVAPYTQLVSKYPKSEVMLSNEVLSGWGSDPVSLNKKAVDYLRQTLNYTGVITTDDIGVFATYSSNKISLTDAVIKAYNAGVTMPLFKFTDDNEINSVISAVQSKVAGSVIDSDYNNVMAYKKTLGLKTTTTLSTDPAPDNSNLTQSVDSRKKYVFQVLLGLGFTKEKAAAIWGNLYQESGSSLEPKALEHGGAGVPGFTGHGIVQWSWERWRTDYGNTKDQMRTPNAARKADLTNFDPYPPKGELSPETLLGFAKAQNKDWFDLGIQVQFIKKEVGPGGSRDPANNSKIKEFMDTSSTDISQLTMLWGRAYEGPRESDANWSNRISGANLALKSYGSLPAIDPGTGISTTTSSGCNDGTGSTASGGAGGVVGGPTSDGNKFTEYLLKVPSGAYGRNVWYYNQANPALNSISSLYTQGGHTWRECGCAPTTVIAIVSSFTGKPTNDPAGILSDVNKAGGVYQGCPGQVDGLENYFKTNNYDVVMIKSRSGFHNDTKADFDGVRSYLKKGYLIFTHTEGHYLGIYAADDKGNFYLFDTGARANSQLNEAFTEAQINSGSGMAGPSAGFGLNEFWAVKPKGGAPSGAL